MTGEIKVRWNKRERDIEVVWNNTSKGSAMLILSDISSLAKQLNKQGYDITTLKFSIKGKEEKE